ncbi:hypothetical protein IT774_01550 [Salinimonas marina]|uniref:ATP-grasp domain-containing protein n=1 Tax=Salinimonas marina TaxID=2785918 RepID=A0A7S9DY38_9ALTE|nr:hypothetical protein [Salinimonas marina]QPG05970.1 hypothetical protein IT774_01550 [Salinimonas marina]
MRQTVLIIGKVETPEVRHLMQQLTRHSYRILVLDTSRFGSDSFISYEPERASGWLRVNHEEVAFKQIHSVFWDQFYPFNTNNDQPGIHGNNPHDKYSLLEVLFQQPHIRWFNSVTVMRSHKCKPWQLTLAAQGDLRLPATCIGNHPDRVRLFLNKHPDIIIKPVHGGRFTYRFRKDQDQAPHHTGQASAQAAGQEPATLQQYIGGTNIRSYLIDDYCFCGELQSSYVDFREDSHTRYRPHTLPDELVRQGRALMLRLGMHWGAIDWRLDEQGHYYFLEINPAPRFAHFETISQLPIAATLARCLCAKAGVSF